MAPTQSNELIQTVRHDRPPSQQPQQSGGRCFTPSEVALSPSDLTVRSGNANDDGDGAEHEGRGGGDGRDGWQPYEQRESHFRPWLGKSNPKHRSSLSSQWQYKEL